MNQVYMNLMIQIPAVLRRLKDTPFRVNTHVLV